MSSGARLPENELIGNILHDTEDYNDANHPSQGLNVFDVQRINGPVVLDRSLSSQPNITLQECGLLTADDASGRDYFLNHPYYAQKQQYGEGGNHHRFSSSLQLGEPNHSTLFYNAENLEWSANEDGYAMNPKLYPSLYKSLTMKEHARVEYLDAPSQMKPPGSGYVTSIPSCQIKMRESSLAYDTNEFNRYLESISISAPENANNLFQNPPQPTRSLNHHQRPPPYKYDSDPLNNDPTGVEGEVVDRVAPSSYAYHSSSPSSSYLVQLNASQMLRVDADSHQLPSPQGGTPQQSTTAPRDLGQEHSFGNFGNNSATATAAIQPSQYGYYTVLDCSGRPKYAGPSLAPSAAGLDGTEGEIDSHGGDSSVNDNGGNKKNKKKNKNSDDSSQNSATYFQSSSSCVSTNAYSVPLKTTSGYSHEPPFFYCVSPNPSQQQQQPCLFPSGTNARAREYSTQTAPVRVTSALVGNDNGYGQMATSYNLSPSGMVPVSRVPVFALKSEHVAPSPKVSASFRSPLLEEFRNTKGSRKFELKDVVDHFVEFSGDQYGSRFIQQKLEVATNEEKQMVFQEIFPVALQLMTDVFGNYVIQKYFEYGTGDQKKLLGDVLEGNVLNLSLQMYGCRVVQKAFEVISADQQAKLVREFNGFVLKCIKDQNGNHVIQKVIEQVPADLILFIVDTFKGKVCNLAMHPYGCRVIQRILEHCSQSNSSNQKDRHSSKNNEKGFSAQLDILDELLRDTARLVQDQYGNYVVQHVLENGRQKDKRAIIGHLEGKIVTLSQHKFASNVIEKCVQYGSYDDRQMILREIVSEKPIQNGNYLPLEIMMKDAYANYVVQKILEVCDSSQRNLLVLKIKPHVASLKRYTYAKHIIARLEKVLGKPL